MDVETETKAFNAIRRSYAEGKQVTDVSSTNKQYKSAFFSYVRKGKLEALSDSERKAMLAGDDANGGYLLPPSTIGRVVKKLFELSPIRQIAAVQAISTQALEGMYDNDESSYGWVAETGARTDDHDPTLGKYRIEAFEMYADPKATQTLLDDAAVDVEAWLADKVADKFARVEAAAFITGTGVGQPRGFTTYTLAATGDATRTWGQIEKVKTGANGDFAASNPADKLFDLIQAFKTAYLQNAQWVTTREVIAKVRKFKEATTNAYMWQPGLAKGTPDTLLGYPIVIAQDVPALATGSASMWLGDWKEAYQIVDRQGVRTLRDPYTDKPYVHFYSTKRVGGGVLNFEAIKASRSRPDATGPR
jgi:HK97 family phage major capsid protein